MIKVHSDTQSAEITLRPNCSASWHQNHRIIVSIAAVNGLLSSGFIAAGAWLVIPIIIIETLLMWLLMRCVFHRLQIQQIVSLNAQFLSIDIGHHRREQAWLWPRNTSCVLVSLQAHPWDPLKISLSHCGRQVLIGEFLNKEDSHLLLNALRQHLPVRHYSPETSIHI
ncbi:Uncharacterised protein [Zhongshania aliphaticivorans]|uniref:DUF2244 domain-containing protein n=1 Tax=Zhongshania aliphaticivorans TaxID=1470434 RepID=A0A5S9MQD9_9GAMM|nr:DUF2244 domain-containing protein [Zhongshania aliphaticivorans]CAA0079121.1 Uncharacterised protein [Zhongshania aliphaticivorans]CAA0086280.1 Uncharacterised protein [Zhongshania aliphaticivorans]